MADEIEVKSESEKKKEDWMNSKWRPMMGWMYMLVCTMDFVGFPVLWSLLQMVSHGNVGSQWQPLTLQGAGLFHIAMGAVIGISAYGRTQEKLGGANNGGLSLGAGTTYVPPGATGGSPSGINTPSSGFTAPSAPQAGGFSPAGGFNSPAPSGFSGGGFGSAPAPATGGFGGGAGFGATAAPAVTASGKKIVPDFGQPAI
jgi:hypothetical protein